LKKIWSYQKSVLPLWHKTGYFLVKTQSKMKKDLWSYLDNPFNNVTKGNFKRMIMMVQDHRDKLKRAANLDPALMSLFNVLDPAYTQFSAAYQHNKIVQQRREMQTGQFELLMTKMPAMTQEWDYQVIEKYRPSTPEYQFLMSEGRTGLYKLAYELRLSAVSDFIRKLQDFPSLSSLLNEVTAWYQNAMFVRETQQGYEGELQQAQTSVEQARQNLAQKMHYVWAGLLMHYIQEPERV
jgi:DNA repair ATPase RecN